MPIRITLTGILDEDLWGADQAFAAAGSAGVEALLMEDLQAMMENLTLKVEPVTVDIGAYIDAHTEDL